MCGKRFLSSCYYCKANRMLECFILTLNVRDSSVCIFVKFKLLCIVAVVIVLKSFRYPCNSNRQKVNLLRNVSEKQRFSV